jgi:hypothetical protein
MTKHSQLRLKSIQNARAVANNNLGTVQLESEILDYSAHQHLTRAIKKSGLRSSGCSVCCRDDARLSSSTNMHPDVKPWLSVIDKAKNQKGR